MPDLGSILDRVSAPFVALDRQWRCTYVSRPAADLFGRTPEELIGKSIWTQFPQGDNEELRSAYEKAMSEQVFIEVEAYHAPWDRWFENRIYPSSDGLSIFLHEITTRKRAEASVRDFAALVQGQNQVLELIARGAPLETTLATLLRVIEARAPDMLTSILLIDPDGVHLRHGASPSLPPAFTRAIDGEPIGPCAGSCGTAAFRGEDVVVDDIATDPLWEPYRDAALAHGLRACWSTPIFDAEHRVLGTFAMYFRTAGRPDARHRQLIDVSTHIAAVAIAKSRETDALRASEERLRLAVEGANVGIWVWEIEANRLIWSDRLKAMFAVPPGAEQLSLETFLESVHRDDRPGIEAQLRQSLAERTDCDVECRIFGPAGAIRWVAAKGHAEYDASGRAVRMMGVALDVTERKRAGEEIARREAQLAEAQRIAHLGSYEWNLRTGAVQRSEELCRIFGVEPRDFPPTFENYIDRVHPDDRHTTRTAIERSLRDRQPFEFEERILRPDGQTRVLFSQGKWILDRAGEPVSLVGISQDVTERREAEQLLRSSEERFQLVARATNDVVWDWNLVSDAIWWGDAIATVFKYPPGTAGDGAWWRAHIHPADRDRVVASAHDVMDGRKPFWSAEYRFRLADDSYADIFDRGFVHYDDDGTPTRMIGAMADISERRRALEILEQRVAARTTEIQQKNQQLEHEVGRRQQVMELLRARNEELKAFAYTVSHDLKAPLRGIAGYAQELERRHSAGLTERARFCLRQILNATRNLDHLIEDLLQYARLDAETPTSTDVDTAAVIQDVLAAFQPLVLDQGAEVVLGLAPARIRTWERGLRQVLTNLIDNALKYSRHARPGVVRITTEARDDLIRLNVADNGIGFDMQYHDRMFGLFNRLVRHEEFEGTGAGLAIVKKIVDKIGGKVWAESKPGEGATFYVELPRGLGGAGA